MRILFCHDGPLRKDEEHNYYGIAHNDTMFSRYYRSQNDELVVAIRVKNIPREEGRSKFAKITVQPFKVAECPNLSNFKGFVMAGGRTKKIIFKEAQKADYVIARLPSFMGSIAADAAKKAGKPFLLEVVGCPWDALWNRGMRGKIVAPFMCQKTKKLVRDADYSIYVTNSFLQTRYPTAGKHISCSDVMVEEFDGDVLDRRIKKIDKFKNNEKIVIGTIGAVDVWHKGQQYVIEALGRLKRQGIGNYEYQIVGGGNTARLRRIAKKHEVMEQVRFLGGISRDQIYTLLDKMDLYAQPSLMEGLPRALIEAMSRGLPAFGARTGGIPELIDSQFIFSNTRKKVTEICDILRNFDKGIMKEQAKRNYAESRKYEKKIIEERRNKFIEDFLNNKVRKRG